MTNDNTAEQLRCREAFEEHFARPNFLDTTWLPPDPPMLDGWHYKDTLTMQLWLAWESACEYKNTRADSGEAVACDEPIGWWFQHDETGRVSVCINDGVNDRESFLRLNKRFSYCGELFTHPSATSDEVKDAERYRHLRDAKDTKGFWIAHGEYGRMSRFNGKAADDSIDAALYQRVEKGNDKSRD